MGMMKQSSTTKGGGHQKSISSYFSPPPPPPSQARAQSPQPPRPTKRSAIEVVTLSESDDDDEHRDGRLSNSHKKTKLETGRPVASTSKPPLQLKSNSNSIGNSNRLSAAERVAHWRFDPSTSTTPASPSREEDKNKRAALAAKLLANANRVLDRRSAYLQNEHYLAPKRHSSVNDSSSDGNGTFHRRDNEENGWQDRDDDEEDDNEDVLGADDSDEHNTFSNFRAKGTAIAKTKGKGKEKEKGKGKGKEKEQKYTPLEKQVIALKKANPGVVLMVEVGYKYRFFAEDAQIASRTLGIACFPLQHMLTASIPTHRLNIHVKRLINNGYKVGIVSQMETAALKKTGDNKSGPFTRAVSAVYTSATYIDELAIDPLESLKSSTSTLLCLVEEAKGKDEAVRLGLVAVMPNTGEVIYDDFEDGLMRSELETRMLHLQPSELVLQREMSRQTESIVKYLLGHGAESEGIACRVERIPKQLSAELAYSFVSDYLSNARKQKENDKGEKNDEIVIDEDDDEPDEETSKILDLPENALIALAALIQHLQNFSLDTVFLHTHSFSHFSSRSVMTLQGNALTNLEILRNSTDYKEKGSLISILDRCKTPFGRRLLRKWVARPLVSLEAIVDRSDAVTEIAQNSGSLPIVRLREVLRGLPDLERGLIRIYFGRATPVELLRVLQAFQRLGTVFEKVDEEAEADGARSAHSLVKSATLKKIVKSLPDIRETAERFLSGIEPTMAREGKKEDLFTNLGMFEELQNAKDCLIASQVEIQQQLTVARKILRMPALQFVNVAQEEYLLEIRIPQAKKLVPDDWIRINSTKNVYRYRTPVMQKKLVDLEAARETVAAEADKALKAYLKRVAEKYEVFRDVVASIATADCLFSLAEVARLPGYCRPKVTNETGILKIVGGRHPMVEAVLEDPFVPNDVSFGGGGPSQMVLTGLNMGGKSSLSRSIALIALMAQIGSYVPAESCLTSIFDGIYTRMGATDDLARGRSTFMVELSETSEILKMATPRSLIVLDELGRGTSTMDGQAIAGAVLQYIVTHLRSICIFITHYPQLAEVAKSHPESVAVAHMACLEKPRSDGFVDVVFLYKLATGLASRSHGLNVARLADLPESVLSKALEKSQELERAVELRKLTRKAERYSRWLRQLQLLPPLQLDSEDRVSEPEDKDVDVDGKGVVNMGKELLSFLTK